jgi:phage terminase large subunit-like protein
LGKQELQGEVLFDVPGALWTRDMLEKAYFSGSLPQMKRVVVAVDPSGTREEEDAGDSVGIVVAGLGEDEKGYVLADRTCKLSPDAWGREAVRAYREFKADRIVAERNFGGAMVEHVLRTVDRSVSYREVTASRGKVARCEPVAALYEQQRIRHAGSFPELEDQACAMTSDGYTGDGSPDRLDAAVWAISDLMLGATFTPTRWVHIDFMGR